MDGGRRGQLNMDVEKCTVCGRELSEFELRAYQDIVADGCPCEPEGPRCEQHRRDCEVCTDSDRCIAVSDEED